MSELITEPAQTYQLNVLASALGRFAAPGIDSHSISQTTEMVDQVVGTILTETKPIVPHTNSVLLEEAVIFDDKLHGQLTRGRAATLLPRSILSAALGVVEDHRNSCQNLQNKGASQELLVEPNAIADSYGLTDLWDNSWELVQEEALAWSRFTEHPAVPPDLQRAASLSETRDLMRLMWRHVIKTPTPEVSTYLTDNPQHYHVFWAPLADTLDYATPRNYDRATQLSFDLPHNATHLAHLDALRSDKGVFRYDDNMGQRAYFEAATVFSEYQTITEASSNSVFTKELHSIISPDQMTEEELAQWIVQDRGYEFKLRAARYAADVLMINGEDLIGTTHEVASLLNIPLSDAEKETRKYLAWTGLGAVYTFGYRRLRQLGTESVTEALTDENGNAITSWKQRLGTGSQS